MDIKGKHLKDLTVDEFKSVIAEIVSFKSTCDISLKTWLNEKELMFYVSLGRDKIRKARQDGKLPSIDLMGRIIYERSAVDAWIRKESKKSGIKKISKNK